MPSTSQKTAIYCVPDVTCIQAGRPVAAAAAMRASCPPGPLLAAVADLHRSQAQQNVDARWATIYENNVPGMLRVREAGRKLANHIERSPCLSEPSVPGGVRAKGIT